MRVRERCQHLCYEWVSCNGCEYVALITNMLNLLQSYDLGNLLAKSRTVGLTDDLTIHLAQLLQGPDFVVVFFTAVGKLHEPYPCKGAWSVVRTVLAGR